MRINNFMKTTDLIHRAMDASLIRENIIANNLTNQEVPNFKRSDLAFESELKKALDSEKRRPLFEAKMTSDKHMPFYKPIDYTTIEPRRILDYVSTSKANGNNVDAEQEHTQALKNQMMYTLLAQSQTFEYGQINLVLR